MSYQVVVFPLSKPSSKQAITRLFSQYGRVYSVKLVTIRLAQGYQGYAFIELEKPAAERALTAFARRGHHLLVARQMCPCCRYNDFWALQAQAGVGFRECGMTAPG